MYLNAYPATIATTIAISDGAQGIAETLAIMGQLVKSGKKSMMVREQAISLCSSLEQKDWSGQVRVCHAWVRDCIRYIGDITNVETVQTPEKTMELRAGDCDDKSTLLCALLESIGHPTRFVAIGFSFGEYSHVYVETLVGSKWVPLESTEPVEVGWNPGIMAVMKKYYYN